MSDLLFVARFVGSDQLKPVVGIQRAEKHVLPAIGAEVALFGLVDKGQGALAHGAEFAEHGLFFADELRIEWNGRFEAREPQGYESHRQMPALEEGVRARDFVLQAIGGGDDETLDHHEVSYDFGGAPFVRIGVDAPVFGSDGVGGAEKFALSLRETGEDGRQIGHGLCGSW